MLRSVNMSPAGKMNKSNALLLIGMILTACNLSNRPRQSEVSATLREGQKVEEIYDAIMRSHPLFEEFHSKGIPESRLIAKDFRSSDGAMASSVFFPSESRVSVVISNSAGDDSDLSKSISERLYNDLTSSRCCSLVELKRSGAEAE